jgi:hypothetical protein
VCLFLACKGDERDVPAPLHGNGDFPLMSGAVAGDAPGKDLAPFRNEEAEGFNIFVIDKGRFIYTEPAHLLADLEPSPLVASAARPAIVSVASSS